MLRPTTAAVAALLLAGCASPGLRWLAIATAPSDARTVSMMVVSTRKAEPASAEVFSGDRGGDGFGLRVVSVAIPPSHRPGMIEWPRGSAPDPGTQFAATSILPIDLDGARDWFDAQGVHGHVLIFVHGFNVPFPAAVYRLAQMVEDAAPHAAPVLFTWPSRGEVRAYIYDRESAAWSRDALEETLRLAARNPHVTQITVFAHSMGAWLAMEALRQYAIRSGGLDPKIQGVILAAPDVDVDVFRQQLLTLGPKRPHFTLLVAHQDHALQVSRMLAGGIGRLGGLDPAQEPYRSELARLSGVQVVDMSGLGTRDHINHALYAESPEALRALKTEFEAEETPR